MPNIYEELEEQIAARGQSSVPQPQPVDNPYADMENEIADRRDATIKENLYRAQQTNPDEYARAKTLGDQVGLHPDTVMPNLQEMESRRVLDDRQDAATKNPAVSNFLLDQINAHVAQDDLEQLSLTSKLLDALKTGWNRAALEYELGWIGTRKGLHASNQGDAQRETELRKQLQEVPQYSGFPGHLQRLTSFIRGLEKNVETASIAALGPAAVGAGVGFTAGGVGAVPGVMAGYAWGLGTGIIADMARGAYGDTYVRLGGITDDAGNPMSEPARQLGAVIAGAGTFAVGKMAGGQVADATMAGARAFFTRTLQEAVRRPTVARAFGTFAKTLTEAGLEGAALNGAMTLANTLGEQAARLITPNIQTIFADPAQQEQFRESLVHAMIEGLELFPYMKLPGAAMGFVGDTLRARQANIDAAAISDLGKGIAISKTRERSLSTFIDFMRKQTEGSSVEHMAINGDALMALYQSAGVDPFSLRPEEDPLLGWLPDRDRQLREAIERKGDVVVPSADFLSRLAGTPALETLTPDIRVRPDSLTLREANDPVILQERMRHLVNLAVEFKQSYEQERAGHEPMQRVFNDVYSQLLSADTPANDAAKYALLLASHYATRAERNPAYADAWTAYEKSGLKIQRSNTVLLEALHQAAKRIIYGEKRDLKVTFKDTGIDPSIDDRGQLTKYLKSVNPTQIKKLKLQSPDEYLTFLTELVKEIFPDGADLKFRKDGGVFDYDHFLKDAGRRDYVHSLPETLRSEDVHVEWGGDDAKKAYYIKKYFDPDIQKDIWDIVVLHNNEVRTKFARKDRRGSASVENIVIEGDRFQASVRSTPEGDRESASTPSELHNETITSKRQDVNKLEQGKGGKVPSTSIFMERTAPRASLQLPPGGYGTGQHLLNFFAARDRSSFLHEGIHLFLEELVHDASLPDAPEQVKADLQIVKDWFAEHAERANGAILEGKRRAEAALAKTPDDSQAQVRVEAFRKADELLSGNPEYMRKFAQTLGADIQDPAVRTALLTPFHELFARHGEAYFMKGEAPSPGLQGVFDSFRAWLKSIYQKVAGKGRELLGLSAAAGTKIEVSSEVRGVMDRLLATDEQIALVRRQQRLQRLFKTATEAGMTEAEFQVYNNLVAKAEDQAKAQVQARALQDMQKQKSDAWNNRADELRPEVEAQINARPDLQALHYLRTGKLLGEDGEGAGKILLSKDALVRLVGERALKDLPYGIYRKEAGADPQEVAEMFGYRSGSELARDLLALEAQKRDLRARGVQTDLRQHLIDEALTARLQAHFGDIMGDGTMPKEAMDAVHNDTSQQALAMELRALIRQSHMTRPVHGPAYDAKGWAREAIGGYRVSDVVTLSRYARDEAKAGEAAERAMAKGDLKTAIEQKQAQIMNHAFYIEAKRASDALDKLTATAARYAKKRIIKSMDQGALDQVHNLLERFGLKNPDQNASSRETLSEWVRRQQDMMGDVIVPESLFDPSLAGIYKDLTVSQMLDLATAIKSIIHVGREAQKITVLGKKQDFQATVEDLCRAAFSNVKVSDLPLERNPGVIQGDFSRRLKSKWMRAGGTLMGMNSSLLKREQIMDELDGKNLNGPWNSVVFRRAAEREGFENKWRKTTADGIRNLAKLYPKEEQKKLSQYLPDISELMDSHTGAPLRISHGELLSIALNWGNASNRSKMLKGENWRAEAVQSVLERYMTKTDWDFVQGVWDLLETMRPEIAAREKRMTGVEPIWVEALPVETPFGEYRGGYYPMTYDPLRSGDAADRMIEQAERLLDNSRAGRPTTDKGYTMTRVERYARPIKLSLDVLPRHIENVIKDLAWREYVFDMVKLFKDPSIRDAMIRTVGRAEYDQMIPWLKGLVNDRTYDPTGNDFWNNTAHWLRTNATMVGLGYRVTTMLVHGATAASNSIGEVGVKWMAVGVKKFFGSPQKMAAARDFVFERSSEMRHRMDTVDRDVRDGLRELLDKEGMVPGVKRFAYYGIAMLDMASAMPTWIAAYEKALHEGMIEADAIYAADKSVRNAHGGGGVKDMAAVQRGSEFQKLTTMFYSFWNHFYNRQVNLIKSGKASIETMRDGNIKQGTRDFAAVLARSWWYFVMPQIIHGLIKTGGPGEDDSWLAWTAEEVAAGLGSGIPGIRDVVNALMTGYEYQPTPAIGIIKAGGRTGGDLLKGLGFMEGAPSGRWLRNALETTGYVFGLPTGQAGQSLQYIWDIMDGEQSPEGTAEFMHALIFGPNHGKKH